MSADELPLGREQSHHARRKVVSVAGWKAKRTPVVHRRFHTRVGNPARRSLRARGNRSTSNGHPRAVARRAAGGKTTSLEKSYTCDKRPRGTTHKDNETETVRVPCMQARLLYRTSHTNGQRQTYAGSTTGHICHTLRTVIR